MNGNRGAAAFLMHEDAMRRTGADVTAGQQTEYQKTKG